MTPAKTAGPPGRPLTKKGLATRAAILEAAHDVFRTQGYFGGSVSEITRSAGVSMGSFYQYFKNKEQVFLELNDLILARFIARTESLALPDRPFEEKLMETVRLLYRHSKENFAFHKILGESELIDRVTIGYYETIARYLRSFLRRESQAGRIRGLDPNVIAYGLIGVCYFHTLDWGPTDEFSEKQIVDMITDFFLNGISGAAPWKRPAGWRIDALPQAPPLGVRMEEPLSKGEKTRQAILGAAEEVLGRQGVHRANIADITRRAGVAHGTFYIHFESKADLIEGFVKFINRNLRRELQRHAAHAEDRREAERIGMLAFYRFIKKHRAIYRVVPEFELIGREVGLWYYKKLAQGYVSGIERGIEKGEIRQLPAIFLVRALMGFTHFTGLKWVIWANSPAPELPKAAARDGLEFIFHGLKANGPPAG
jgi:AcrR family transcriptional regulator